MTFLFVLLASFSAQAANLQPTPGQGVCFQRVYSNDHMRANPRQLVSALTVWVQNATLEEFGYQRARVIGQRQGQRFGNEAACTYNRDGSIRCAVDCDGGSFRLENFRKSVSFRTSKDYYFPLFRQGADPENAAPEDTLSFNDDDKDNNHYVLVPVSNEQCEREWNSYKEVPNFGC